MQISRFIDSFTNVLKPVLEKLVGSDKEATSNGETGRAELEKYTHVSAVVPGKGFVGCSYYDMNDINSDRADSEHVALFKGVKSYEDLLKAPITQVSNTAASNLGIRVGMTGEEALKRMMSA